MNWMHKTNINNCSVDCPRDIKEKHKSARTTLFPRPLTVI